ncbi:MAG: EscU/YscU/HrcU family type III secretion system export apparatus switch protein [Desulfobacterales bacterium]|nr:EscU/YscU/HrcU family type III secretion system export apparatus switch protein [Desulfobacterales bacterium]
MSDTPDKKERQKIAVALRYKPETDKAPMVTAKGSGLIAEKIIEIARAHGIPVKDDPDLVEVLSKLEIEDEIPASVYVAVAELLAFIYSINGKKKPF